MSAAIRTYIEQHSPLIDRALRSYLPVSKLEGAGILNDAIAHAVLAGGKRMRPVLTLLAAEVCGAKVEAALPGACAVEFLHAASLALDDLPAMDDAGLRRGRATVHVLYGQDQTILAALALLNAAYGIFAGVPGLLPLALREIGVDGMIGGQAGDLCSATWGNRLEKTTALTRLTMATGASAAGASAREIEVLMDFGHALGEAYQICDDIADTAGAELDLGKTAGQDARNGRRSIVNDLGREEASEYTRLLIDRACHSLRGHFGDLPPVKLLEEFVGTMVARGFELVKPQGFELVQ